MYFRTGLLFYKFRFLVAGLLAIAFLMLVSALVTAIGSNTVLDAKTHPSVSVSDAGMSGGPNIVTTGASALAADTQHTLIVSGGKLYSTCRSVTTATVAGGRATAHGSAVAAVGVWNGTMFVARGVGSITWHTVHATGTGIMFSLRAAGTAVMFTLRLPGRVVGSIGTSSGHTVSALITTPESKPVPVISTETSAAALARLSTEQQQQISKLLAGQLAANQSLEGVILAGDPHHGGYPAKWDNAPQDSMLDSWGMYSRECVSYAAWKVYQTYGHMPYWGGRGNANEWPGDARRAGIPTSYVPKVHSVAIWRVGYYGHAMWVEAVRGNMVYVSQYNYDLHGHYSEMWVNGSHFTYIYFR